MREKIKLSGVPETMLQTIYARAKESRGRGAIHDAKAEEIIYICGNHESYDGAALQGEIH